MKMFYLCIVKLRDGICAAGRKNYRSGQAGKFTWAGRKMKSERRHENEILCLTKNHYKIMALKVKAVEKKIKFDKNPDNPGVWRYVMSPELYAALTQAKVIKEAALRSGVSKGVMQACWDAAGEVIKAWATEGHSVALPGLGTMRFGLRSKSVEDVNKVKTNLITSRRIIFTPDTDLKDELKNTSVVITCYDRNGNEVKRVTSDDDAEIEDNENENGSTGNGENGSTENGGSQNQGGNSNTGGGDLGQN